MASRCRTGRMLKAGRGVAVLAALWAAAGRAGDATWNWEAEGGRAPEAPARWTDAANWVGEAPPDGDTAVAYLVPADRATTMAGLGARYVRVPEAGVDVGEINFRQYAKIYLLGGPVRFGTRSTLSPSAPRLRDEGTTCSFYCYAPLDFSRRATTFNRAHICGPLAFPSGGTLASSHNMTFALNAWADDASGAVTNPLPCVGYSIGSGRQTFLGRMGADAQTGVWRTFAGSPVLRRVGAAHDLAAGAPVRGAGIPDGAFVKCVYARDAVELSVPCAADSGEAGVEVAFGGVRAQTVQRMLKLNNQAGNKEATDACAVFTFTKLRGEDAFDVRLDDIGDRVALDRENDDAVRSFAAEGGACHPARVFLASAAGVGASYVRLGRVHLVFSPAEGDVFEVNALDLAGSAGENGAWASAGPRLETPEGVTARVGNVRRWSGTVTACGGGTLEIASATNVAHNALVVEEGLTALRMAGEGQTLAQLAVSNGAAFRLAAGRLKVRAGAFAAGAEIGVAAGAELDLSEVALPAGVVLRGPGTVVLASPAARDGTLRRDAPVFRFAQAGEARDLAAFGDVVPAVVGRPAFWFDAARNVDALAFDWTGYDGAVTRYANGVACWRDCRAGETAFYATNDFSQIATGGAPCVPARRTELGGWPCLLFKGLAYPGQSNDRCAWSGMVWNRPITNVCAVFHVVWAPQGGQAVLGCTRRFAEMGSARERNDFLRGVTANQGGGVGTVDNRLLNAEAADCVRAGWIYCNGVRKAAETAEGRSGIYLLECHPRAPYGRADAFAVQEHAGVTASGCQASFECIVYTNALSMAERRQVCAYLMEKYGIAKSSGDLLAEPRFEGAAALEPAADADEGVEVAAGQLFGVSSLTNGHVLVKTGAGRMYVDYVGGGSGLDVREGALVVQSRELTAADVPAGAFVHLDATATNRMLLTARGPDGASPYPDGVARTEVTVWRDRSGASPVAAQRRTTDGRYKGPSLAYPAALGGRPVVDYGVFTNTAPATGLHYGWGLFHDFTFEETVTDGYAAMSYTNTATLGSVFMMIGSKNGGGVPLGGYDVLPRWRQAARDPGAPFFSSGAPAFLRQKGGAEGWLNGRAADLSAVGLSGGYDVVSVRAAKAGGAKVQSLMMADNREAVGGGELGEVILYERPLSAYWHGVVDAYLNWKWFARATPGFAPSRAASVRVAEGATLEVAGGAPLRVGDWSGSGAVEGGLALAPGAVLRVAVREDGTLASLAVTGALDCSAGGTVVVEGAARKLALGEHVVAQAAACVAGPLALVVDDGGERTYSLHVDASGVRLRVLARGTFLLFR